MRTMSSAVSMTDEEFRLIRDQVYAYCGIYLPESVKYLVERRLQPRLAFNGLESFRDYHRLLKYSDSAAEFDEIVERVTTNETYFFREAYQLRAFTDEVLPELTANVAPRDRIRVWSAGCSTGEEPYSIAMLLEEAAAAHGHQFDIFGNDISKKVLRSAREALYRPSAFRQTESYYIERYFAKEGSHYRLNEEIRNKVTFGHMNLMDKKALSLVGNVHALFCRNVMIYFAKESREELLETFYKKLRPGGYLFLGHSESLINLSTEFELVPLQNDIVYRKPKSRASTDG